MRPILIYVTFILALLPNCTLAAEIEYTYDTNGRMTRADLGGIVFSYSHDNIGNILSKDIEILNTYDGDIDNSGSINLVDSILGLQVISGVKPARMVHQNSDVDNDQKIGLEEVIFILRETAAPEPL